MRPPQAEKTVKIPWWGWILAVDIFLVSFTALKQYPLDFPGKAWLTRHFNLAVEMNAAVWWSSVCLIALALLAYELYSRTEERSRFAWLSLALVLAALSLDESGSLHERVSAGAGRGWRDLLPYAAVLLALFAYSMTALFSHEKTRKASLLIAAAFCVFGAVALQERLEHHLTWPEWSVGLRTGIEEGSELFGIFLLFLGIRPPRPSGHGGLRTIVPDPFAMQGLAAIILGGAILHTLAVLALPGFFDVTHGGNPLIWYPVAVFFLLFCVSFWQTLNSAPSKGWIFLTLFFLLASVASHHDPPRLLPVVGSLVPKPFLPGLFIVTLAGVTLPLAAALRGPRSTFLGYRLLLPVLPLACFLDSSLEMRHFAAGSMALLLFLIFRPSVLQTDIGTLGRENDTLVRRIGQETI